MADGKLYVIITDDPSGTGGGGGGGTTNTTNVTKTTNNDAFSIYLKGELASLAKSTIMRGINFSIQQIGDLRGQYFKQQNVQNVKTAVDTAVSIYKSATVGAAAGSVAGPMGTLIGAAVGAGIQILNSAFDTLSNIHTNMVANAKQNYDIEQLRKRAGLDPTYNGSRGTEN